jgi:hypothetical protein
MPYYRMSFIIEAEDEEEADDLSERVLIALGCTIADEPCSCPHHRVSGWHRFEEMPEDDE